MATALGPSPAWRRSSTTSRSWASTPSGCCRSIRRRCATTGDDIADYTNVHPDYGTLEHFRQFIQGGAPSRPEGHHRTGHQSHVRPAPAVSGARLAPPGSREREFYVWSDDDKQFAGTRIIFTDTRSAANWACYPVARQYYWHRFFSHQPDLNHNNPEVVEAVIRVMRFWMDMGVDGMRLDAMPYLCVREGTNNENSPRRTR